MAKNTFIGKIHSISQVESLQTKKGNAFQLRTVIIEQPRFDGFTGEPYQSNFAEFEFSGRNVDMPVRFAPGQLVEVSFQPNGQLQRDRDGRERAYTHLRAFDIQPYQQQQQPQQPANGQLPF